MRIDVHWHLVPPSFVNAILSGKCPIKGRIEQEGDEPVIVLESGFRQELSRELTDPALAIARMDQLGLDVVAPSVAPPLMHYDADPAMAVQIARTINDGLAEAAGAYPTRFRPLATLPLQDPGAAVAELRRAVTELGFAGTQIATNVNDRSLGHEDFYPFWEAVRDLDCFVLFHPFNPIGRKDRLNKPYLMNFVGLPVDTAAAVASLIFDGVYERFGPLKTCFSHGGGAFPYLLGRWEHGYHARLKGRIAVKPPRSYLDSVYADTVTHSDAGLRFLIETLGAEHVVLGSDYPFDMGEADPNGAMERAVADPETRRLVGGFTAAGLLGLKAKGA